MRLLTRAHIAVTLPHNVGATMHMQHNMTGDGAIKCVHDALGQVAMVTPESNGYTVRPYGLPMYPHNGFAYVATFRTLHAAYCFAEALAYETIEARRLAGQTCARRQA